MPKATTPTNLRAERRHNPLEADLVAGGGILKTKSAKRKSRHQDEGEHFVDSKASRKILRMGQELADEDAERNIIAKSSTAFDFKSRIEDDDEDPVVEEEYEDWGDEEEVEEIEINAEDQEAWKKYMPREEDPARLLDGWGGAPEGEEEEGTDLAALILQKIQEKEEQEAANCGIKSGESAMDEDQEDLHPKVVEVYTKIAYLLSRYKSGKLPKPFKILPSVPRWEEIIQITQPEKWTPNACYEATKIFISGSPATAQSFMEHIILERVREEIYETKKLNVHLFNALKKSLYKPAAFFKGFLFPLVRSGHCTLREAHVISGVLVRVSIPVLHSAAAIKGLCDIAAQESNAGTEGGGATNIFIKALLEKKYALPFQVIDALVFHILRFRSVDQNAMIESEGSRAATDSKLPVIWHQSLLAFAQRYRNDITEDQREALLDLLLTKGHSSIGPEIRRELLEGRGRGVLLEPEAAFGGDDTMLVD